MYIIFTHLRTLVHSRVYIVNEASCFSQECEHHKTELQQIRRENASLDTQFHENDKSINQLKTTVAVLQQEIKDKEQVKFCIIVAGQPSKAVSSIKLFC